jgi:hypothetical protein
MGISSAGCVPIRKSATNPFPSPPPLLSICLLRSQAQQPLITYHTSYKPNSHINMTETTDYLSPPRDKHDFASLERIEASQPEAWAHLVPELLTWLQDPNWPISCRVREVLLLNPTALVEPIRTIWKGDDEGWQSSCLNLVRRLPRDTQLTLQADLEIFSAGISDETERDWELRSDVEEVLGLMVE